MKKILVPTDASDAATQGVDYAISIAGKHQGTLHGLHVVDVKLLEGPFLRDLSASLGTAPYVSYESNIATILQERGRAALDAFQERCAAAGVPCETTLETGNVPWTIVEHSELMDLIVMGRAGEHQAWLGGVLGSTTQSVVRRAKCPVLVTPRANAELDRMIVAYDGSSHAKKALQLATQLGESWGIGFDVLVVSENDTTRVVEEAESYVEAHELEVSFVTRNGDPGETIVDYAEESEADLIVMGGYGHTKVRELMVGSTTAYTMHHAPCPILLTR